MTTATIITTVCVKPRALAGHNLDLHSGKLKKCAALFLAQNIYRAVLGPLASEKVETCG